MYFRLGVTYHSLNCFSSSVPFFYDLPEHRLCVAPSPQFMLPIISEFIPMDVYSQVLC